MTLPNVASGKDSRRAASCVGTTDRCTAPAGIKSAIGSKACQLGWEDNTNPKARTVPAGSPSVALGSRTVTAIASFRRLVGYTADSETSTLATVANGGDTSA